LAGHHHHHGHDHGHAHGHSHGHGHGHGHHHHGPANYDTAFAVGIALNLGFVVAEAVFGFLTHSVALLADAGHNLSDVLGLGVAWGAATLARRGPSKRFTYGLKGSTILAALLNALVLLVALGAIMLEAAQRLLAPTPVVATTMAAVAAVGILVNLGTALLFARGRKDDLNLRGAYLHMTSDAAVSAGVVVTGLIIWRTGAWWLDPAVSLVIAVLIFLGTWSLLRETVELALGGVPRGVDFDAVAEALAGLPGVARVHDLHIWAMSTTETVLTAHLVMPGGHPGDGFLAEMRTLLQRRFGIGHATAQIELEEECATGGC